jgi:hypothetical protein
MADSAEIDLTSHYDALHKHSMPSDLNLLFSFARFG